VKFFSTFLIFFLCEMGLASAGADPTSDLASPSQATRDRASAILRKTYVVTPQAHFEKLAAGIKMGETEAELAGYLASHHVAMESSFGSMSWNDFYRIDAAWVLHAWGPCNPSFTVAGVELVPSTQKIWVQPPAAFSGNWTEYYANGQKLYEKRQNDPDGVNEVWYYDNGRPSCVSTNTENTYYYRDGRVQPEGHITESP